MNWFEDWFDSPYYHLLYKHRDCDEASTFISNIVERLQIPKGSKVIDIACGKGRHAVTMEKLGLDVTGVDLSENSIVFAKRFENEHLHFHVSDMRHVFSSGTFDYVFNIFSSFGYFENEDDNVKVFHAFAENLKKGGHLVMDYMNAEWVLKNMKSRDIIQVDDIQFHIQKRIKNGFIVKQIDFLAEGENYSYEEKLKLINFSKFEQMIEQAGLTLKNVYGDYQLNPLNFSNSPRLIFVAEKK